MNSNSDAVTKGVPGGPEFSALGRLEDRVLPAWLRPTTGENRLAVAAAILAAVGLQLMLSRQLTLIPGLLTWLPL